MENMDNINYNNFFFKFKSLDKELESKVKCLLKGCHKIAKYSISLIKPNSSSSSSENEVKFICSNHLENWDDIKLRLIDEKLQKEE